MAGYRRIVSFSATTAAAKRSSCKIRTLSLPVRFHPIVSHMNDDVAILLSWSGSIVKSPSPVWLLEGVQNISSVLASLLRLINHPLSMQKLRDSPSAVPISDDILCLTSLYNSFRISLLDLGSLQANTWIALRRQDPSCVALAVQAQKEAAQNIEKLASTARKAAKTLPDITGSCTLSIALCNAIMALASATSVVFIGISALSDESVALALPLAGRHEKQPKCIEIEWMVCALKWELTVKKKEAVTGLSKDEEEARARIAALENFDQLHECIKATEIECEKVYNDLVNARVNFLNIIPFKLRV